jgi:hypothetical protein
MRTRTLALVASLFLSAVPTLAIPGDLNLDGRVDFDNFFLFADNFGQIGPPDTLRVEMIDTLIVELSTVVFDTTEITVFDTVFLDTVHDTLTVEFVAALDAISASAEPSHLITDWSTGEPLRTLGIRMLGDLVIIKPYYRQPIDADDDPRVDVDYDKVPVAASFLVQYAANIVSDDLTISAPDTVLLHREVRLLRDGPYVLTCCGNVEYDLDAILGSARFPDIATTAGSLVLDVVLRTPEQGDFTVRGIAPVTVSATGKVIF